MPDSFARAFASMVLPVPGGPKRSNHSVKLNIKEGHPLVKKRGSERRTVEADLEVK